MHSPQIIAALTFLAVLAVTPPAASSPAPNVLPSGPPDVTAMAAVLMDARSGRVLYAKSPHLPWPPASTTKVMTALLAMEALPEDASVPISPRAASERSGSAIGLEAGERWKAGDLFRALLMHSANDAAVALAEAVSGSVEQFAAQMTVRARALGALHTRFITPHGRYNPGHFTTAYDLALITRAALQNKELAQIVRTPTWELIRPGQPPRLIINTNKLLWRFPGADGVKTGWIAQSGQCLVASATRNGWQLIAVLLNAPRLYADAAALFNYGFDTFAPLTVGRRGEALDSVLLPDAAWRLNVTLGDDVVIPVRDGERIASRADVTRKDLPIYRGETVGEAVFVSNGVEVVRAPLVAGNGVPVKSVWTQLFVWVRQILGSAQP